MSLIIPFQVLPSGFVIFVGGGSRKSFTFSTLRDGFIPVSVCGQIYVTYKSSPIVQFNIYDFF